MNVLSFVGSEGFYNGENNRGTGTAGHELVSKTSLVPVAISSEFGGRLGDCLNPFLPFSPPISFVCFAVLLPTVAVVHNDNNVLY